MSTLDSNQSFSPPYPLHVYFVLIPTVILTTSTYHIPLYKIIREMKDTNFKKRYFPFFLRTTFSPSNKLLYVTNIPHNNDNKFFTLTYKGLSHLYTFYLNPSIFITILNRSTMSVLSDKVKSPFIFFLY